MSTVIRRNHYDVTDRVFVADPRPVCAEICAILNSRQRNARLAAVEQAFAVFTQPACVYVQRRSLRIAGRTRA